MDRTASPRPTRRSRELLREGSVTVDVLVDVADGGGPAIVLLPSSQRDSLDFDALAERIAGDGFCVLRPQPRGMARSSGPMAGLSLNVLADDVALAIERLGGGRAVVVGHAFGHFVARVLDMNRPALVRGVVALGAAARTFPAGLPESLAIAADPTRPRDERLAQLQFSMFAPGNDASPWLDGWHPELRAAYRAASAVPAKDTWWPVSHSPVLDLQGAQDRWRPPATRSELQDLLGDKVTVREIPGAGHALIPEQPGAVAEAVTEWVRALGA